MEPRRPLAAALALAIPLACSSPPTSSIDRGPANYNDPKATPRDCSATPPTMVAGGLNPAADPGTTCPVPVRDSALLAVAPGVPFGWIDLGERGVGERVTFDVPAGTASLTILEQWVSGGPANHAVVVPSVIPPVQPNAALIGELVDPQGHVVYTDLEVKHISLGFDPSAELLYVGTPTPVTGTVTHPSTSAGLAALGSAGLTPGTWNILVSDYAYECWLAAQPPPVRPPGLSGVSCDPASALDDGRYRVFALTKPMAGGTSAVPATGSVDVAFHIVDAPTPILGIDSTTALTDPHAARMLQSYGALLAGAGLCLGTVTFYDAPDWARTRFATEVTPDDGFPCGNFYQLMALSIPGARTLDVFLVPRLTSATTTGGATVVGIDPTIPGPATVNGTVASGVVVSAQDLAYGSCPAGPLSLATCGADVVGFIAAHESGHYLGLYHDSERFGDLYDPISDTPHCECSSYCGTLSICASLGLTVPACDQHYERCSGGKNLMFWLLSPSSQGYLSPQQGQIIRSSPLVSSP